MFKAGILSNTKTGRFHPIYFRMALLPGGAETGGAHRYKSLGHHTDGFDTLELAEKHIAEKAEGDSQLNGTTDSGRRFDWDGEDIPALVEFF